MEQDMKNFRQYKMGYSKTILLAKGTMPSRFDCQVDGKKRPSKTVPRRAYKRLITDFDQEDALNTPGTSSLRGDKVSETGVEILGLPANKEIKTVEKIQPKFKIQAKFKTQTKSKTQIHTKSQAKDQFETPKAISSTRFRVYSDSTKRATDRPTLCIQPCQTDDVTINPYHTEPDGICSDDLISTSYSDDFKAGVESVIAKVYKFFKQEYLDLVKKYGVSIDMRPFFEYKERTAAATGASLVTVDRVIQETTGRKPRKKRQAKKKANCDVDTSATESCDEVRSEEIGINECDDDGEDFSCQPESLLEDEVWCGMPASSIADTDPIEVVVKDEPDDDEESIEGHVVYSPYSHTLTDPIKNEYEETLFDNGELDGETVIQIEKMEFTEEEFT